MKNFSLKFLDIMIGLVLGLGFQWWPDLRESWQFIAFVFVYLDIVDYWIDYGPSLKKFPPKREIDVLLDVAIMFSLFLYIYTTQLTLVYFFGSFILLRTLDFFWLLSSKQEYHPIGTDGKFVSTWLKFDLVEVLLSICFVLLAKFSLLSNIVLIISFIIFRFIMRFTASLKYKRIHFV